MYVYNPVAKITMFFFIWFLTNVSKSLRVLAKKDKFFSSAATNFYSLLNRNTYYDIVYINYIPKFPEIELPEPEVHHQNTEHQPEL